MTGAADIIDISQPLGVDTAVWPGDRPIEVGWTMSRARGDSVNVAALCATVHAGTHVDGPYHFDDHGMHPAALPLSAFIGPAIVIDARGADILDARTIGQDTAAVRGARLLFRTRDAVQPSVFPDPFAAFDPDFARDLARAGVALVGTDAPSVDPLASKTLDAHRAFAAADVAILENIVLDDVEAGRYLLIALPLRLLEADSSPVRAVLVRSAAWLVRA